MNCLFMVRDAEGFNYKVYGVRTKKDNIYKAEFLIYACGMWMWSNAEKYAPLKEVART